MKVVYCDDCNDISIKSRLEEDRCNRCGRGARRVPYGRPWQYYAGSGILLAASAFLLLVQIPNIVVRVAIIGLALVAALALSTWSIRSMRARILKRVHETSDAEAKI